MNHNPPQAPDTPPSFSRLAARGVLYVIIAGVLLTLFGVVASGVFSLVAEGEFGTPDPESLLWFVSIGTLLFATSVLPRLLTEGAAQRGGAALGSDEDAYANDQFASNDSFAIQPDPYGTPTPGGILSPDNVGGWQGSVDD